MTVELISLIIAAGGAVVGAGAVIAEVIRHRRMDIEVAAALDRGDVESVLELVERLTGVSDRRWKTTATTRA
jgi:hypothetical protein